MSWSRTWRPKRTQTYPGGPLVLGNSEKRVALLLHSAGVSFTYEVDKLKYHVAKDHTYTPDFCIPHSTRVVGPLYLEVKGLFASEDRMKHLTIKEQHPDADIRFIFDNANKPINKGSKTTYASWCEKHGFLWAQKTIPQDWIQ